MAANALYEFLMELKRGPLYTVIRENESSKPGALRSSQHSQSCLKIQSYVPLDPQQWTLSCPIVHLTLRRTGGAKTLLKYPK